MLYLKHILRCIGTLDVKRSGGVFHGAALPQSAPGVDKVVNGFGGSPVGRFVGST